MRYTLFVFLGTYIRGCGKNGELMFSLIVFVFILNACTVFTRIFSKRYQIKPLFLIRSFSRLTDPNFQELEIYFLKKLELHHEYKIDVISSE